MESKVLLGKLILGVIGILLSVLACFFVDSAPLSNRQFSMVAWTGLVATRVGLFVTMFVVLRLPAQSDVAGYYYPQMKIALAGGLPYRDYFSAYAPLFAYLGGAVLWLWDSPKAIVVLTLGFEAVGFAAWRGVANQFFSQRTARLGTLLYIVNALPLFNTSVEGQNQTWVSCFLGLSTLLLLRKRWMGSGAALGGSLVAVKFLPVIFVPALWLHAERRTRWIIGCGALLAAVYGICLWAHLKVWQPLLFEGKQITCGCLPFLLAPFCPEGFPIIVFDGVLLLAFAVLIGSAATHRPKYHPQRCVYLLAIILFTLLVLSKKAFTNYLVLAWFPICLCAVSLPTRRAAIRAGLLGAFGTLALLEPSLWFRWFNRQDFGLMLQEGLRSGSPLGTRIRLSIFFLCEVALVGSYIWYAFQAWKLYLAGTTTDESAPRAGTQSV